MPRLSAFAMGVDRLSRRLGRASAALLLLLIGFQTVAVMARHAFGSGALYAQDGTLYLFALALLGGIGWLGMADGHVRVDLFRDRFSPDTKRWMDLTGILLLWLPFAGTLLVVSIPYAMASWAVFEGSRDRAGVDLVFLLKTALPVFAALLLLQGVARFILILDPRKR